MSDLVFGDATVGGVPLTVAAWIGADQAPVRIQLDADAPVEVGAEIEFAGSRYSVVSLYRNVRRTEIVVAPVATAEEAKRGK